MTAASAVARRLMTTAAWHVGGGGVGLFLGHISCGGSMVFYFATVTAGCCVYLWKRFGNHLLRQAISKVTPSWYLWYVRQRKAVQSAYDSVAAPVVNTFQKITPELKPPQPSCLRVPPSGYVDQCYPYTGSITFKSVQEVEYFQGREGDFVQNVMVNRHYVGVGECVPALRDFVCGEGLVPYSPSWSVGQADSRAVQNTVKTLGSTARLVVSMENSISLGRELARMDNVTAMATRTAIAAGTQAVSHPSDLAAIGYVLGLHNYCPVPIYSVSGSFLNPELRAFKLGQFEALAQIRLDDETRKLTAYSAEARALSYSMGDNDDVHLPAANWKNKSGEFNKDSDVKAEIEKTGVHVNMGIAALYKAYSIARPPTTILKGGEANIFIDGGWHTMNVTCKSVVKKAGGQPSDHDATLGNLRASADQPIKIADRDSIVAEVTGPAYCDECGAACKKNKPDFVVLPLNTQDTDVDEFRLHFTNQPPVGYQGPAQKAKSTAYRPPFAKENKGQPSFCYAPGAARECRYLFERVVLDGVPEGYYIPTCPAAIRIAEELGLEEKRVVRIATYRGVGAAVRAVTADFVALPTTLNGCAILAAAGAVKGMDRTEVVNALMVTLATSLPSAVMREIRANGGSEVADLAATAAAISTVLGGITRMTRDRNVGEAVTAVFHSASTTYLQRYIIRLARFLTSIGKADLVVQSSVACVVGIITMFGGDGVVESTVKRIESATDLPQLEQACMTSTPALVSAAESGRIGILTDNVPGHEARIALGAEPLAEAHREALSNAVHVVYFHVPPHEGVAQPRRRACLTRVKVTKNQCDKSFNLVTAFHCVDPDPSALSTAPSKYNPKDRLALVIIELDVTGDDGVGTTVKVPAVFAPNKLLTPLGWKAQDLGAGRFVTPNEAEVMGKHLGWPAGSFTECLSVGRVKALQKAGAKMAYQNPGRAILFAYNPPGMPVNSGHLNFEVQVSQTRGQATSRYTSEAGCSGLGFANKDAGIVGVHIGGQTAECNACLMFPRSWVLGGAVSEEVGAGFAVAVFNGIAGVAENEAKRASSALGEPSPEGLVDNITLQVPEFIEFCRSSGVTCQRQIRELCTAIIASVTDHPLRAVAVAAIAAGGMGIFAGITDFSAESTKNFLVELAAKAKDGVALVAQKLIGADVRMPTDATVVTQPESEEIWAPQGEPKLPALEFAVADVTEKAGNILHSCAEQTRRNIRRVLGSNPENGHFVLKEQPVPVAMRDPPVGASTFGAMINAKTKYEPPITGIRATRPKAFTTAASGGHTTADSGVNAGIASAVQFALDNDYDVGDFKPSSAEIDEYYADFGANEAGTGTIYIGMDSLANATLALRDGESARDYRNRCGCFFNAASQYLRIISPQDGRRRETGDINAAIAELKRTMHPDCPLVGMEDNVEFAKALGVYSRRGNRSINRLGNDGGGDGASNAH